MKNPPVKKTEQEILTKEEQDKLDYYLNYNDTAVDSYLVLEKEGYTVDKDKYEHTRHIRKHHN
jgi:hypothetical protein